MERCSEHFKSNRHSGTPLCEATRRSGTGGGTEDCIVAGTLSNDSTGGARRCSRPIAQEGACYGAATAFKHSQGGKATTVCK